MRYILFTSIALSFLLFTSCKNSSKETTDKKQTIVFRFKLDSAGNITDAEVKKQLAHLAVHISANADKVVLYSYTEKMKTAEESLVIATQQANAAKMWMYQSAKERIYYSVGVEAKGFENPVDATNPYSLKNRRIEIEFL
ncbi:MAG: hypothetical protein V4615_15300 [Bacteroidota bacterium]